jgi:hypothetical protein
LQRGNRGHQLQSQVLSPLHIIQQLNAWKVILILHIQGNKEGQYSFYYWLNRANIDSNFIDMQVVSRQQVKMS